LVSGGGHRGIYIALGAFIVVAVLFAAGLYLPSRIKTLAGAGKIPVPAQQAQQADSSSTAPSSATPSSTTPSTPSGAATSPSGGSNPSDPSSTTSSAAGGSATPASGAQSPQAGQTSTDTPNGTPSAPSDAATPATPTAGSSAPPTPPRKPSSKAKKGGQAVTSTDNPQAVAKAEEAAAAEEVEKRYDDIDSRSAAVSGTLDGIQKQQAAAGYGLRGDIVSAQQRMKTDLSKAQFAMQKQDTKSVKKYLDMAEAELQTIEKFLGR